jgi:3-oxoacyl-[acyl-carrier-protein] synthase III
VATVVGEARPGEGIVASHFASHPTFTPRMFAHTATLTDEREYLHFQPADAKARLAGMVLLRSAIERVLAAACVELSDVEWVLLHQPSGAALDAAVSALGVDPARVVRVVDELGDVASACIPACLDRLLRTRAVRPGDRILMAGAGVEPSSGAVLYRVGGA